MLDRGNDLVGCVGITKGNEHLVEHHIVENGIACLAQPLGEARAGSIKVREQILVKLAGNIKTLFAMDFIDEHSVDVHELGVSIPGPLEVRVAGPGTTWQSWPSR